MTQKTSVVQYPASSQSPARGFGKCPPSITGTNCQNVSSSELFTSCDYLRLIMPGSHSECTLPGLLLLIKEHFGITLDTTSIPYICGRKFLESMRSLDNSIILGYNFPQDSAVVGEVILNIGGSALSRLPLDSLHTFCRTLYQLGAHCTRFDVAIDDYSKSYFNSETLDSTLKAGNFSGAHLTNYHTSTYGNGGWLYTIAKRGSDKYLRIYNKSVESKGVIDSYRFEVEYKNCRSKHIFEKFCELETDLLTDFLSYTAVGSFDFIDRTYDERTDRCPRLPWYSAFVESVGGIIKWSLARVRPTIEKTQDWIEKKVIKSIVVISKSIGFTKYQNWFSTIYNQAALNLDYIHRLRVENYHQDVEHARQLDLHLPLPTT